MRRDQKKHAASIGGRPSYSQLACRLEVVEAELAKLKEERERLFHAAVCGRMGVSPDDPAVERALRRARDTFEASVRLAEQSRLHALALRAASVKHAAMMDAAMLSSFTKEAVSSIPDDIMDAGRYGMTVSSATASKFHTGRDRLFQAAAFGSSIADITA